MKNLSISIIKEETAAVAIIVGLLITVFVGFLAIVVDVGYMYEMRRQLQSAADAAALAGMTEIINSRAPDGVAQTYAEMNDTIDASEALRPIETRLIDDKDDNGNPGTDGKIDAYQVTVSKNANLAFAPIFGTDGRLISAQARARRVWINGIKGLIPWGLETSETTNAFVPEEQYTLLLGDGQDAEAGNFNSLDFSGIIHPDGATPPATQNDSGGNYYGGLLANGYSDEVHIDDLIPTKTGGTVGKTRSGLKTRFENCSHCPSGCLSPYGGPMRFQEWKDAGKPAGCSRLVTIPILREKEINGKKYMLVIAFGVFFIESPYTETDNITGRFVKYTMSGHHQDWQPNELALETVRLDKPVY